MQSIETYYLGPTDHRGSRVKARSSGGLQITLEWDNAKNPEHNHGAAAKALIEKLKWGYRVWFGGGRKDGGYIFVCAHPDEALTFSEIQRQWKDQSPKEL